MRGVLCPHRDGWSRAFGALGWLRPQGLQAAPLRQEYREDGRHLSEALEGHLRPTVTNQRMICAFESGGLQESHTYDDFFKKNIQKY